MKIGKWAWILLIAAASLAGCKGFWDAPVTGSFALTNSANIAVSSGSAESGTSTITVTPSSSFTGTVALTCAVTTSISSPTSIPTCSLNSTSVSITGTSAETSTLTATTTATTTAGIYDIKVTGTSGSVSETTTVCVAVGSATCTTTASNSGNFYVLNVETSQIVGYYSNSSGTLTELSGSPVALPASAFTGSTITVAPNNALLYVSTANGIYVYTIASDGALTLGNGGSAISSDQATSMQVDSTNTWLVETAAPSVGGIYVLYAIKINSSTGDLATAGETEQYEVLPGVTSVNQLTIAPNNSYVFVAMGTSGTAVVPFTSGNTNPLGAAGSFGVENSGGAALSVAVDPTNRLFYVGETLAVTGTTANNNNTGGLRAFNFSSLPTVSEISGSPFASQGLAPYSILPVSTGSFVYVANRQVTGSSTGVIAGFTVAASGSTYSLTDLGSTFTAGTNPVALAEDSTNQYVLAVDVGGSYDLMGYTIDSSTGTLTPVISSATGSDPVQASAIAALHP